MLNLRNYFSPAAIFTGPVREHQVSTTIMPIPWIEREESTNQITPAGKTLSLLALALGSALVAAVAGAAATVLDLGPLATLALDLFVGGDISKGSIKLQTRKRKRTMPVRSQPQKCLSPLEAAQSLLVRRWSPP